MEKTICPLLALNCKNDCAWYNEKDEQCCIATIAHSAYDISESLYDMLTDGIFINDDNEIAIV